MRNMESQVRIEAKKPEQRQKSKLMWMIWFVFGAALFSLNYTGTLSSDTIDQYQSISYGMN
ncbi:MAG: hypothetical protein K0U68_01055 [Gammaproteobacteria bacterium]|nr:hypothetical protein [Gammaproteobacteria bacterium]